MATSKTKSAEIIAQLVKLYPLAFSSDPSGVRPLAIGVKEILLQRCELPPKIIADVLRRYTDSIGYLMATVEAAARIDLEGRAVGVVTRRQAEHALLRLAEIAERSTIEPAPATISITQAALKRMTVTAPQPGRRRLGLADLKRAAAVRRQTIGA
jgi:sRNA-binding protein